MNPMSKIWWKVALLIVAAGCSLTAILWAQVMHDRDVKTRSAASTTKPCIDEAFILRPPAYDEHVSTTIACSHPFHRITDRFDGNTFLCRCSPEKVLSDARWVDPLYKQKIEQQYSDESFEYLKKQLNKPHDAPNPPPLALPGMPHSSGK